MSNAVDRIKVLMAVIGMRLIKTNAKFLCLIAKTPDNEYDVIFDDFPELPSADANERLDEMKECLHEFQNAIKSYEDKIRYNG